MFVFCWLFLCIGETDVLWISSHALCVGRFRSCSDAAVHRFAWARQRFQRKPSTGVFECPYKEVRSKSLALAVGDGTAQIRIVDNENLLVENCKLVKIYNNKLYFMQ